MAYYSVAEQHTDGHWWYHSGLTFNSPQEAEKEFKSRFWWDLKRPHLIIEHQEPFPQGYDWYSVNLQGWYENYTHKPLYLKCNIMNKNYRILFFCKLMVVAAILLFAEITFAKWFIKEMREEIKRERETSTQSHLPAPDTLTEWQQLQLALILTESKGDATAVGKNADYGILQITPIFVAEANRISGMAYTHEDAFDIDKSLQMFSIVHDYYNPDHDIAKAIKVHNPGSSGYVYRQNLELIRNMEAARKAVKGL